MKNDQLEDWYEYQGCLTGDCPHYHQSECDAALKVHWEEAYKAMKEERDAAIKKLKSWDFIEKLEPLSVILLTKTNEGFFWMPFYKIKEG